MIENLSNYLRYFILGAIFLLAFVPLVVGGSYFFPFVGPKGLLMMALIEIAFFAWLWLLSFDRRYLPRFNIIFISVFLFFSILVLATVFGADPIRSFWSKYERMTGILMWIHLILLLVLFSAVFKKDWDWQFLFFLSTFVALIVSGLFFKDFFVHYFRHESVYNRMGSTLGNSSFMGTYLLFNLFFAFWGFLRKWFPTRYFYLAAFLVIALALLLSDADAAKLSAFGGLALLLFFYLFFKKRKEGLMRAGIFLFLISIILGAYFFLLIFKEGSFVQKIYLHFKSKARILVWQIAWNVFKERPVLGWGPENFELPFNKHFDPRLYLREYGGEIWFDRAHNIVLDTLVSSGIIGFIFYLFIFALSFAFLIRRYLKDKNFSFVDAFLPISLLVAYFVQNLTVFDMPTSYLMWFFTLGYISFVLDKKEKAEAAKEQITNKIKEPSVFALFLVIVIFLVSFKYFVYLPHKKDRDIIAFLRTTYTIKEILQENAFEKYKNKIDFDNFLAFEKKVLNESPLGDHQVKELFMRKIGELVELFYRKTKQLPSGMEKIAIFTAQEGREQTKRVPLDYRNRVLLARVYDNLSLFGDRSYLESANEILQEATKISPKNPYALLELTQNYYLKGDFEKALKTAEKAVNLEPRVLQSQLTLLNLLKVLGRKKELKEKVNQALLINPQWEKVFKEKGLL